MMLEAAIWVEEDDRDQNMIHIDEGKMSCKIFLHTHKLHANYFFTRKSIAKEIFLQYEGREPLGMNWNNRLIWEIKCKYSSCSICCSAFSSS